MTIIYVGDIFANEPIYVVGSLTIELTDPEVLAEWDRRSRGQDVSAAPVEVA
ncbi:hypothetical protein [Mycobacterium sp.]|uniref:hypothetical protein n=1 Tax=Mycobacterium sp. TaxID=1785 RepID=UPI002C82012D|nr:hypothetical protein [Mycobacterium sp.]HKP44926.1 hypothetical protein [Mycobacterium sp.]